MKSKFSLTLAPLKIPSSNKTTDRACRENLHRRDSSPPPSPYPGRRSLDPRTEAQLRASCVALSMKLQAQEQAQMGVRVDSNARVDYEALHRKIRQRQHDHELARQNEDSPVEERPRRPSKPILKQAHEPEISFDTEDESGHVSRARFGSVDDGDLDAERCARERSRSVPRRRFRGAAVHDDDNNDTDDERPRSSHSHGPGARSSTASTPHSSASDYPRHHFSTTATSVTPFRSSMHEAKFEHLTAERDAQRKESTSQLTTHSKDPLSRGQSRTEFYAPDSAIDNCDNDDAECERKRRVTIECERDWSCQPTQMSTQSTRSNSRARHFAEGFGDYFRSKPNRRVLSRKASKDSIRDLRSPDEPRSSTSSGWRGWGFNRRDNSLDISPFDRAPALYSMDDYRGREMAKSEVNLNRALPPLPSLDEWEANQRSDKAARVLGISPVARPRAAPVVKIAPENEVITAAIDEESEAEELPVRRPELRDSGISSSNNIKLQPTSLHDSSARSSLVSPVFTMNKNLSSQFVSTPATDGFSPRTRTPHPAPSADVIKARAASHRRQASEGSIAAQPNLGRKISMDGARSRMADARYPNTVKLNPADKKGLRRVISGWFTKKESHWTDRVEKEGFKGGLILPDEKKSVGTHVVRY